MQHLQQLADKRAADERILAAAISAELADAEKEFEATAKRLHEQHSLLSRTLENEFAAAQQSTASVYDDAVRQADASLKAAIKANDAERAAALAAAEHHA